MKRGTKFCILLLAGILTFAGFNMLASSDALQMIKIGNDAGLHIIANHLATKEKAPEAHPIKKGGSASNCPQPLFSEVECC
ncbi:MAG: hypothetical protein GTO17_00605 [Candidatus Aminicenantes bacterium]|nr:hypothetical protein [Candidatus Aminicenantes bacterium]